ncbi:MAG: hypothetical protein A2498_16655 [Lentisphaerae bacterium RIFOXYC12_FULL_60_16]|nr:MAG: hypothetical protein A2498_16655 [Lentisphaerae bacterium RIFOXYC12_FULL_60_16]OGV84466.1 MAG: hypothetical protein A2340_04010 [Lentisphaerae bacterium RIFOXYB12_FULL_60_10]
MSQHQDGLDTQDIRETARKVADKQIAPNAAKRDQDHTFPWDAMKALAEVGLLQVGISTAYGGMGGSRREFTLIAQEVAKACASTALVYVTNSMVAKAIEADGNETTKRKWLPLLLAGKSLGALAVHEPDSGCIMAAISTRARKDGDTYVINGSKFLVTSAGEADVYLVIARPDPLTAPQQMHILLVEKDIPGLAFGRVEDKMGLTSTSSRQLFFNDCRVPHDHLIGQEGEGHKVLGAAVAGWGIFGAAGLAVGIAQSATERSVRYAKERKIGGEPIALQQAIQLMIADMVIQTDAASALLDAGAAHADANPGKAAFHAFKAKLFSSEAAIAVTDKAIQVHGGHGYCKDYIVERLYRDARGLTLHFKTSELLRLEIAEAILKM